MENGLSFLSCFFSKETLLFAKVQACAEDEQPIFLHLGSLQSTSRAKGVAQHGPLEGMGHAVWIYCMWLATNLPSTSF